MAWNEPGSGKQRDPWKDSGGGPSPDFDAWLKRISGFFTRLFGGGGGGGGFAIAAVGIVIAWLIFDSWIAVKAGHVGVVLRFGEFARTMAPGFNLKWPRPIEAVMDVDAIRSRPVSDQVRMLTKDENIVLIDYNVQYTVSDPQHFLFSVRDPDETLKQAAESAVREVIGANDLSSIMPDQQQAQAEAIKAKDTTQPSSDPQNTPAQDAAAPSSNSSAELAATAQKVLQQTLDRYDTGLTVSRLNFQNVRPPQEVKEAFDDAISAREDRQRRSNEAAAYAKSVVPNARGDAARILAEAEGYKAERVAKAEGDAERFNLIASEYKAAPEVTRKRLYIETMQKVLAESSKVIDLSGGKNLLYLPLDGNKAPPVEAVSPTVATPDTRGTH